MRFERNDFRGRRQDIAASLVSSYAPSLVLSSFGVDSPFVAKFVHVRDTFRERKKRLDKRKFGIRPKNGSRERSMGESRPFQKNIENFLRYSQQIVSNRSVKFQRQRVGSFMESNELRVLWSLILFVLGQHLKFIVSLYSRAVFKIMTN